MKSSTLMIEIDEENFIWTIEVRIIFLPLDFFNYICLRCEEDCNMERECPFSHNDNEYNYHPLYYKVIPCERMDSCLKESCPNAHKDDMRIIYNVNNPIIKRLECLLNSSLSSMDIVPNFTFNSYKLSLPAEFDPRTYKTFPCPLGDFCLLNSKLCLNYHGLLERRRSLAEIKYSSNPCQYASYDNKWKAVTENECRDVRL